MKNGRSKRGIYARTDAVIRFLRAQPEGHYWTAYGVAISINDPGCTKYQAYRAIALAILGGYVEHAPQTVGRAITYRATGRRYP